MIVLYLKVKLLMLWGLGDLVKKSSYRLALHTSVVEKKHLCNDIRKHFNDCSGELLKAGRMGARFHQSQSVFQVC